MAISTETLGWASEIWCGGRS